MPAAASDPALPERREGDLLVNLLRQADRATALSLGQWDRLIRQARRANLLARLCVMLDAAGLLTAIADQPRRHLEAARILADKHQRDVRWEVRCLCQALAKTGTPIVLLKGAAYALADLPPAGGRIFTDIDIMVPKERLAAVETALLDDGWFFADTDPYDQHYYRTWMHQLPPLMHFNRGTLVDVHHTIVPETARSAVAGRNLLSAAIPIADYSGLHVLAPADMVLHSAVHLFNEGDFTNGLRDLVDLDSLLRHFGRDPVFFAALMDRAAELGLDRPLAYALQHLGRLLATPLPASLAANMAGHLSGAAAQFTSYLIARTLQPRSDHRPATLTALASWMLYVRGHALRMPPRLLLLHLARKALRRT